jgi:endonuclease YncB( thermonuclease family)
MSQERDAVRNLIREEVTRAGPIEEAKGALELIIESSLRWSRNEDGLVITVVSRTGEPRFVQREGHESAMSIHDLVAELRTQHPGLFRVADRPNQAQEAPGPTGQLDEARSGENASTSTPPDEREPTHAAPAKPERDVWFIGTDALEEELDEEDDLERPSLTWVSRRLAGKIASRLPILHGAVRQRGGAPDDASEQHHPASSRSYAPGAIEPDVAEDEAAVGWRGWRRPAIIAPAALGLLIAIGLSAAFLTSDRGEAPTPPAVETAAPASSDSAAQQDTASTTGATAATAAQGEGGEIRGVPQVLDTAALFLNGRVVRLFGVQWAKGAGSPDQLAQYLAGREVSCTPTGSADMYRCSVDGRDLSTVVLYNGGGRTTEQATADLKLAEEHARRKRVGLWSQQEAGLPAR